MTGVQISVEYLQAASTAGLVQLLSNAEDTTRSYGRKIKNKEEQLQRIYGERDALRDQVRLFDGALAELTAENATLRDHLQQAQHDFIALRQELLTANDLREQAREQVKRQQEVIGSYQANIEAARGAEMQGELATLKEELARLKAADAEKAAAEVLEEPKPLVVGAKVKVLPEAKYRDEGAVISAYTDDETDLGGCVGTVTGGPDPDGDFDVEMDGPALRWLTASPEYLEVVS